MPGRLVIFISGSLKTLKKVKKYFNWGGMITDVQNFTSNFMMTGKEVALPMDIMLGTIQDAEKVTAPDYVQCLQARLGTCFEEVRAQLKHYRERQKKYYNLSTHGEQYKPGDLV